MTATSPIIIRAHQPLPPSPSLIIGVDEAGRGPLAGPVSIGAVCLDPNKPIPGLADSKKLSAHKRSALAQHIRERALAWSVIHVEAQEIDRLNILQATLQGMRRAVLDLLERTQLPAAVEVWIDGNQIPARLPVPAIAVIKGDARVSAISAASILAKTERDARMHALHLIYPLYGFDQHAGYPVPAHLRALESHGPSPEHRQSFAPVRKSQQLSGLQSQ